MALKTKADYEMLGKLHAETMDAAPFPQHGTSWQAIAYWRGRRSHRQAPQDARKQGKEAPKAVGQGDSAPTGWKHLRTVDVDKLSDLAQNWPHAAWHHTIVLAGAHNVETRLRRRARLHRSIRRMVLRHSRERRTSMADIQAVPMSMPQLGLNTPMTTQPHPDGDITVGDILAGR